MHPLKSILIEFVLYKKIWLVVIIPLCFLPIPIYFPDKKGKCAYVVLWMCSYWTTEALPLAIAGLLPCVVMPLLSIAKIEELAMEYIKDTSLLFFGGIVMAMGIEKCKLHQRVAISVLRVAGAPARRVAFGFMATAWFLSMWMNNTATTTMMVPLVRAIILQLKAQNLSSENSSPAADSRKLKIEKPKKKNKKFKYFGKRENPESLFSSQTLKHERKLQLVETDVSQSSFTPITSLLTPAMGSTVLRQLDETRKAESHFAGNELNKSIPSDTSDKSTFQDKKFDMSILTITQLDKSFHSDTLDQSLHSDMLDKSIHSDNQKLNQQPQQQDQKSPLPQGSTHPGNDQPDSPAKSLNNNSNIDKDISTDDEDISKLEIFGIRDLLTSDMSQEEKDFERNEPPRPIFQAKASQRMNNKIESSSSNYLFNVDETYFENCLSKLSKCLLCGVAYSSTIGGTASLIGTSPNLILKGQITEILGPDVITFANWMVMALPVSILTFLISWLWLVYHFMGKNEFLRIFGINRGDAFIEVLGEKTIKNEYKKLGPLSYAEKNVAGLFILLIILWVTRDPGFVRGWGQFFKEKYVSDTQAALFVAFLLFILPSKNLLEVYQFNRGKLSKDRKRVKPLMDWKTFSAKMPWDILFLLGGGFALAKAIRVSELDVSIASTFHYFSYLPHWVLVIVLCVITCLTTEVASNVATATIYLPIVAYLSTSMNLDPLYLMVPIGLSCSFSFMLPVGTPPNSIAYAFGDMDVLSMIKVGCVISFSSQVLIHISLNTWTGWVLNIDAHQALHANQTID